MAILFGTIIAVLPVMVLIGLMIVASLATNGFSRESALAAFMIFLCPVAVTLPVVTVASLLIGVPVTMVLSRLGWENASAYVAAGTLVRGALPLGWGYVSQSHRLWLALMGAAGGATTAGSWWISVRALQSLVPRDTLGGQTEDPMNAEAPSLNEGTDRTERLSTVTVIRPTKIGGMTCLKT